MVDHNRPPNELDEERRLEIASKIVRIFLPERVVYISLSTISAVIVIYMGAQLLRSEDSAKYTSLSVMFGSGGVAAYSLARLLHMFNTIIDKVFMSGNPAVGAGHGR
jgi:hypothetical protein